VFGFETSGGEDGIRGQRKMDYKKKGLAEIVY
jgi:hypothetical protein